MWALIWFTNNLKLRTLIISWLITISSYFFLRKMFSCLTELEIKWLTESIEYLSLNDISWSLSRLSEIKIYLIKEKLKEEESELLNNLNKIVKTLGNIKDFNYQKRSIKRQNWEKIRENEIVSKKISNLSEILFRIEIVKLKVWMIDIAESRRPIRRLAENAVKKLPNEISMMIEGLYEIIGETRSEAESIKLLEEDILNIAEFEKKILESSEEREIFVASSHEMLNLVCQLWSSNLWFF